MNNLIAKYGIFHVGHLLRREYTLKYIKEFEKYERRPLEIIKKIQLNKFKKLIKYATENTTHYSEIFNRYGIYASKINKYDDLLSIPELSKDVLRYQQDRIVDENCCEKLSRKTTGGSTGEAVSVLKSRFTMAKQDAAMWRSLRWHGIDVGDRQARFWGVSFGKEQRLKNKLIDLLMNRIRLSAFESGEVEMHKFVRRIQRFKPTYFYGYVSILKEFAEFCIKHSYDISNLSLKGVVTTSEPLTSQSRNLLTDTFHCRVINDYGSGETGPIAYECEDNNMHLMSDNLLIEIINESGKHAKHGEKGEVVVTELNNYATPLIRYNIKDIATMHTGVCNCGRGLPIIESIEGRDRDVLIGANGQKTHGAIMNYIALECEKLNLGLKQYQAIQNQAGSISVNVIAGAGFCKKTEKVIISRLKETLGASMDISIKKVEKIEREPSGKLRVVKCYI